MLCASLDREGVLEENGYMYVYGYVPSFSSPETITVLLIGYTTIQNIFGIKKTVFKKQQSRKY